QRCPAPSASLTPSLHDALPIFVSWRRAQPRALVGVGGCCAGRPGGSLALWNDATGSSKMLLGIQSTPPVAVTSAAWEPNGARFRSEEHTSELQSRFDLVCRLLL